VSKRAVIIGVAFAVVLCSITYFNRSVMRQTALVGNYLPVSVYGTLILVVVLLNPALARLRTGWRLEGRELAVILALVLAACGVAESGFLKTFTNVAMLPHHYRKQNPGWDHEGTFERIPKHFLADTGENGTALGSFIQGRITEGPFSPARDVPWTAWARPLLTWLPLAIVIMAAFIGLALVFHRQWAEHERLPYPIATFARSLWATDGEGSALSNRGFWIAAGIVLAIHMVNFAHSWWPQHLVQIPTRFDFRSVGQLFTTFWKGGLAGSLCQFRVFFSVVGFAYLVSSDVSLSFGIAPFINALFDGILATYGISTREGGEHRASIYTSLNIGSFVAFVAMIGYFGRRHYWSVLRSCFGLRSEDQPRPHETWGMRTFVVGSVVATILMIAYGLAWPFAIIYMLSVIAFYVAVSRVVAETGLFFMKPAWVPHILLLGVFGGYALGPTAALIAMFFSAVLFAEARETVMPLRRELAQPPRAREGEAGQGRGLGGGRGGHRDGSGGRRDALHPARPRQRHGRGRLVHAHGAHIPPPHFDGHLPAAARPGDPHGIGRAALVEAPLRRAARSDLHDQLHRRRGARNPLLRRPHPREGLPDPPGRLHAVELVLGLLARLLVSPGLGDQDGRRQVRRLADGAASEADHDRPDRERDAGGARARDHMRALLPGVRQAPAELHDPALVIGTRSRIT
jgi:hypothetical protein